MVNPFQQNGQRQIPKTDCLYKEMGCTDIRSLKRWIWSQNKLQSNLWQVKNNLVYSYKWTKSMEQSKSLEADCCLSSQSISQLLLMWNLKAHYCAHKSLSALSTASWIWYAPSHTISVRSIIVFFFIPSLQVMTKILNVFLIPKLHATCPTYAILQFFNLLLGEEYKLWSTSLCKFLHLAVTSSLLGPNILISALFSNTFNARCSLNKKSKFCTHWPGSPSTVLWKLWLYVGVTATVDWSWSWSWSGSEPLWLHGVPAGWPVPPPAIELTEHDRAWANKSRSSWARSSTRLR
jgi:hypothetical protein